MKVELAFRGDDELGEGPVWDERRRALLWVDILRKKIHVWEPESEAHREIRADRAVGAVIPRTRGGAIAAIGQAFAHVGLDDGRIERVLDLGLDDASIRLNDAKCDRRGRIWAGTMSERLTEGAGALYRLDADGTLTLVVPDVTVSNGTDWSPDDRTMYYIDTLRYGIDTFDFDPDSGSLSNRRRLVTIDEREGLADGLTVDAEGCLWVALFGGGEVRRYTPNGGVDRVLRLPVSQTTSCAFGGDDYGTLFVTSAKTGLGEAELRRQPLAGSVFAADAGVAGIPPNLYAG